MNKRECPYCDHPNLANAKFCTACGAAMHLAPCPHCGAVNDISATECYRCHGELTPPETLPEAPASEEGAPTSDQLAGDGPFAESLTATEPPSARPSLLVIGIILLAFAAASYYAFRQRSTNDARARAAPVTAPVSPAVEAPPPKPALTPAVETAAPVEIKPASPAESVTAPPLIIKPAPAIVKQATPPVQAPTPITAAPPRPATPLPTPAITPPPATPAATPSAAPPPVCTEAVAALGLCKTSDAK